MERTFTAHPLARLGPPRLSACCCAAAPSRSSSASFAPLACRAFASAEPSPPVEPVMAMVSLEMSYLGMMFISSNRHATLQEFDLILHHPLERLADIDIEMSVRVTLDFPLRRAAGMEQRRPGGGH